MQRMNLGHRLFVLLLGLVVASGLAAPAQAQEATPTTLTMSGAREHADQDTLLRLDLLREDGSPVAGAQVLVERRSGGSWGQLGLVTTDELGHTELPSDDARGADDNVFRASYAGDPGRPVRDGPVPVTLIRRSSRLSSAARAGRRRAVGAGQDPLAHRQRRTRAGPVRLFRRNGGGDWRSSASSRTGDDGRAEIR